ncbi:amidohydrolase [Ureibacillus massiliensis 4400831 = CIP 108448 = CCUG 49529]|uniref:Amidohydrolase n=1 Tax=Ureibacillus massiliensis 4400831 = CIP 108448 = CCUG 49529 TaxID=1211035 RepID=A0A0A3J8S6_9BACL|nr:amidohydrolase [Ureibacillus massiliensis]KGR91588.1 amidohydrolase [Ureibacillus massiliensis 4400831 = CIP 108448 = CCUG 49529]RKJ60604.1 amidohydrolase [Butyricicoccus sp. 1XD8-22]
MEEQQLAERMEKVFAHLHANPEISWKEINTTAYLAKFLKEEGLVPQTFEDMTGLYVDIGPGTPKVGFRTDIDALWQEVDGEFKANHSCGHDGHMTMAIGVALLLKEQKDSLPGAIRLIFQPAEEKAGGAKAITQKGVIDSLEYLFGVHVRPLVELSDGAHSPALYHGAAKLITGTISGVEAHGARPEYGVNAIEVAAALVDALKRIWISPADSGSIKMTQLQAGGISANIIPGTATFSIDTRAQTNETMAALTKGFEKAVAAVSALYGATITTNIGAHIVAAQVDDDAKAIMRQAIIETVGKEHCAPEVVTPGGEDFHFYSYSRPHLKTTMLGLGCGVTPGLHHPQMIFNQQQLPVGARIIARALLIALQQVERSEEV